jgi:hypothetical protein
MKISMEIDHSDVARRQRIALSSADLRSINGEIDDDQSPNAFDGSAQREK